MTVLLNAEVRGRPQRYVVELPKKLVPELTKALKNVQLQFTRTFARERFLPSPGAEGIVAGGHPAEGVYNRKGELRNTLRSNPPSGTRRISASITIGTSYAALQEFGGTITPKGGRRYLTIPLPAALTDSGKPRFERHLQRRGDGWFTSTGDEVELVPRDDEGKPPLIVRKDDREPLYLLATSVTVPPRLGFFDTWRNVKLKRYRQRELRDALRRAKEGAGGG